MRKVLYILGELEDSDLHWMLDAGSPQHIASGTEIIREGTALDSLFIVGDGELVVSKSGIEITRLGAGEVVGDMSLLDSRPPAATVTATTDATVFAIPQQALRSKLKTDTGFAARFYRALCIFLANRLSRTGLMVNATAKTPSEVPEDQDEELSPDALETLALAGARFDWFLQRVLGK
jgi:CRP-like cAMP-binding protein